MPSGETTTTVTRWQKFSKNSLVAEFFVKILIVRTFSSHVIKIGRKLSLKQPKCLFEFIITSLCYLKFLRFNKNLFGPLDYLFGLADKALTVLKFSNLFDEWCKIRLFDKKTVIVC